MLGDILRSWSQTWLARRTLRASARLARSTGTPILGDDVEWFTLDEAIGLGVPSATRTVLVRAMLDASAQDGLDTDADCRLVDDLVRAALDDLMNRLGDLAGAPAAGRWTLLPGHQSPDLAESWECAISMDAGTTLLRLELAEVAVIEMVRGALPAPRTDRPPMPIAEALDRQSVALSAAIGAATLSLADLSGLSAGDVIVLDSVIAGACRLAVDGTATSARGMVERQDAAFTLTLLQPLHGSP